MRLALDEAVCGCGWVNPNPMVGAVIVKAVRSSAKAVIKNRRPARERNALPPAARTCGSHYVCDAGTMLPWGKTPPVRTRSSKAVFQPLLSGQRPQRACGGKGNGDFKNHGVSLYSGCWRKNAQGSMKFFSTLSVRVRVCGHEIRMTWTEKRRQFPEVEVDNGEKAREAVIFCVIGIQQSWWASARDRGHPLLTCAARRKNPSVLSATPG